MYSIDNLKIEINKSLLYAYIHAYTYTCILAILIAHRDKFVQKNVGNFEMKIL